MFHLYFTGFTLVCTSRKIRRNVHTCKHTNKQTHWQRWSSQVKSGSSSDLALADWLRIDAPLWPQWRALHQIHAHNWPLTEGHIHTTSNAHKPTPSLVKQCRCIEKGGVMDAPALQNDLLPELLSQVVQVRACFVCMGFRSPHSSRSVYLISASLSTSIPECHCVSPGCHFSCKVSSDDKLECHTRNPVVMMKTK